MDPRSDPRLDARERRRERFRERRAELVSTMLPRTVVGLALWLLIFAIGAGTSGVVFFVTYERQVSGLESRIADLRSQFEQRLNDAVTQLQQADKAAQGGGAGAGAAGPAGDAVRLLTHVGPSLAVVEGTDRSGARTSGSGFVLNSTVSQSWILTGYHLVAGSIANAGGGHAPAVTVHLAGADRTGTVYSWDAAHDVALVIVNLGGVPALPFSNEVPAPGLMVWAVAAASGQFGATAARGSLTASSVQSLSTDAVYGPQATGGPLVDTEGKVVGLLVSAGTTSVAGQPSPAPTPAPTPGGPTASPTPPGPPVQAVPVRLACLRVVVCPRPGVTPG